VKASLRNCKTQKAPPELTKRGFFCLYGGGSGGDLSQ